MNGIEIVESLTHHLVSLFLIGLPAVLLLRCGKPEPGVEVVVD